MVGNYKTKGLDALPLKNEKRPSDTENRRVFSFRETNSRRFSIGRHFSRLHSSTAVTYVGPAGRPESGTAGRWAGGAAGGPAGAPRPRRGRATPGPPRRRPAAAAGTSSCAASGDGGRASKSSARRRRRDPPSCAPSPSRSHLAASGGNTRGPSSARRNRHV